MLQGTGSDVGKSLLVAGLCRAYRNRGLSVAPFKPQNMSNNAAVTVDGGEIGRAQALQARAAGLRPTRHMNPVLLKPQTDVGAQVVVQGEVLTNASATDYRALKPQLMPRVLESFETVAADFDLVIVEGAGSAAEVNLRDGDIANMGFALAASVPVVLVGDIDRGGVIASIVGTDALLAEDERALIAGYLINKFRGDPSLFDSAITLMNERTGFACFGVIPYFADARKLPKEDALALDNREREAAREGAIRIVVPRLPRIANFDDLDPLMAEADVEVVIVERGEALPGDADIVLIPGSKATRPDLEAVIAEGWDIDIRAHHRRGGTVVGLCGGYQMLGRSVADPNGIEGEPGTTQGLGLLDVETVIAGSKTLTEVDVVDVHHGTRGYGYEMHMGVTDGPDRERPWLSRRGEPEGARAADGRVYGSYVHGLFAADDFRRAFLGNLRSGRQEAAAYDAEVERTLDALARHLEQHADLDGLLVAAGGPRSA
ncbi:MAG: cobyric acid synthase [Rhodospirillales bacterium]